MESLFDPAHLFNFFALIAYILVKELILDKKSLRKELNDAKARREQDSIRDEQQRQPLKALEVDLAGLKTKVINLENAVEQTGESLDNKLDMILQEFKEKHGENRKDLAEIRRDFVAAHKELSERLTAVEVELKLKPNKRR